MLDVLAMKDLLLAKCRQALLKFLASVIDIAIHHLGLFLQQKHSHYLAYCDFDLLVID